MGSVISRTAYVELRNYIKARIAYAQYRIGSAWYRAEISDVAALADGTVRVKIPIFASGGTINRVAVYNESGEQWTYRDCTIVTSEEQMGVLFWFDFTVSDISAGDGTIITIEKSVITESIRIPKSGWQKCDEEDDYPYQNDVFLTDALESQSPHVALDKGSLEVSGDAGVCPMVQTLDGFLRFWSREIPEDDLIGTVTLFPWSGNSANNSGSISTATETRPGTVMVKSGSGLVVDEEGNLSLDAATMEDWEALSGDVEG